jgi:hypothetical protein
MGIMKINVSAPTLSIDLPEGWILEEAVDTWAVAYPEHYPQELAATFVPNVSFQVIRLESDVTIEELMAETLDELQNIYTEVVVRDILFGEGIADRSLSFEVEGAPMFQYQRNMLLSSFTNEVHWFAQIHATAPLGQEADLRDAFRHILVKSEMAVR